MHIKPLEKAACHPSGYIWENNTFQWNDMEDYQVNDVLSWPPLSLGYQCYLTLSQCHSATILIGTTLPYDCLSLGFVALLLLPCMEKTTSKSRKHALSLTIFHLLQIGSLILKKYGMQKLLNSVSALGLSRIYLQICQNWNNSILETALMSTLHARDILEKSRCKK